MIQRIWYQLIRLCMRVALWFYFREIRTEDIHNLPKDKPVLLLSNHQNAFMDALLIATRTNRPMHYLARADVFTIPVLGAFLRSINMMPVYRIRDGVRGLHRNAPIFQRCAMLLSQERMLLIFPEGNHSLQRRVRPISKGFTRILEETLDGQPDLDIHIVPIGLNYQEHQCYRTRVGVRYGTPLRLQEFWGEERDVETLRNAVAESLQRLTTHIPASDYAEISQVLEDSGADYTRPEEVNAFIAEWKPGQPFTPKPRSRSWLRVLRPVAVLNNLILVLLWRWVRSKFKDAAFHASLKCVVGLVIYPWLWLLQTAMVGWLAGGWVALLYAMLSILILPALSTARS